MPIFICDICGCSENTALGHYWGRDQNYFGPAYVGKAMCSACTPERYKDGTIRDKGGGKWHGRFERYFPKPEEIASGYYINRPK